MNVPFPEPPPLGDGFRSKVEQRVVARRRRHRLTAAAAAVAVAVVVAGGAFALGSRHDQSVHTIDRPDESFAPAPTSTERAPGTSLGPTDSSDATSTTVPPTTTTLLAGTTATYEGVTLVVPAGWSAKYSPGTSEYAQGQCIEPDARAGLPDLYGCTGIIIFTTRPDAPFGRARSGSTPDSVAWLAQSGADCPFTDAWDQWAATTVPGASSGDFLLTAGSDQPVDSGYRPIGDRTAAWASFEASCTVGAVHHVQVWILPSTHIGFETTSTDAVIPSILASVRATG